MNLNELVAKLHKYERKSEFANDIFSAIHKKVSEVSSFVETLKGEFFFDTLTISLKAYEKLMKITPQANATIDERRSAIRARWRANGKNSVKLIQDVCDSWKNGEVEAHFISGKLQIKFVGEYGIPENLQYLLDEVENIKPAHWGYALLFKYLLIEDIHNVKTLEEMEQITLEQFAFGKDE